MKQELIQKYIETLVANLKTGDSSERTHYSAIEKFIEEIALELDIKEPDALIEPKNQSSGIPDMYLLNGKQQLIGHIEIKDLGQNLNEVESTEQIRRYLSDAGYPNLILTNYTEWRLYRSGEMIDSAIVADPRQLKGGLVTHFGKENLEALLREFVGYVLPRITTPKRLALELAKRAQVLRNHVVKYELEKESGSPLHGVYHTFKEYLLPNLNHDDFANLYSQTMAYGLFIGWLNAKDNDNFNRTNAEDYVPKDMPLLRAVFGQLSGSQTPENVKRVVDDIATLLNSIDRVKLEVKLKHRNHADDPIIYFYEDFLAEYDPKEREKRGVYYTPVPVVNFMVRSAHEILKTKFNKPQGFADKDVYVLDPAAGTCTFPVEIMRQALEEYKGQSLQPVVDRLLQQVVGFELMMSSYVLGHFKVDSFIKNDLDLTVINPFRLYLTNTLTNEELKESQIPFAKELSHESHEAFSVKNQESVLVIIGNPPYEINSTNNSPWITDLIKDYRKYEDERKEANPKTLQDDYVKFFRFAQWKLDQKGEGILAFISNHSWLDNLTFRAMRQQLLKSFDEIYVLDLHGNTKKKETAPDGSKDENVFDIQQGVAISILIKKSSSRSDAVVFRSDLFGRRKVKEENLLGNSLSSVGWQTVKPKSPNFLLVEQKEDKEYDSWPRIDKMFQVSTTGIKTHRDHFVIDFDKHSLKNRAQQFAHGEISPEVFDLKDTRDFSIQRAKQVLASKNFDELIQPVAYRPFDNRWLIYDGAVANRPRRRVMRHLLSGDNIAIEVTRQLATNDGFYHALVSDKLTECCYISTATKETAYVFPLWLNDDDTNQLIKEGRKTNFHPDHLANFREHVTRASEEDIFSYVYGTLYTPQYRHQYNEFLRRDFPRIPWPKNEKHFTQVANLGHQLIDLHLMKSSLKPQGTFTGEGTSTMTKVRREDEKIWINDSQYFGDISDEVWKYRIGGYQVLDKWLKSRKGRILDLDDTDHFRQVAAILEESITIQHKLDEVWANNAKV